MLHIGSALFEQLPCPVICLNRRHGVAYVNEAARRLLLPFCPGEGPVEALIETLISLWLGKELKEFAGYDVEEHRFEKECSGPGKVSNFEIHFRRIRNQKGEFPGLAIVLTDITAQTRLAEALRRAYRDMEWQVTARTEELGRTNESLRKYAAECKQAAETLGILSSAVEQTADHVIITNREGVIEYVNPAFERVTGYSRAEAVGKTPRIIKSGRHEPKFFEWLWSTILSGEVFRAVFTNRKKGGELYYEEKTIAPIYDAQGHIAHFVSVGRDVTERKHAESEREKLIEELRAALGKVKQLSGLLPICSHCRKVRDDEGYWKEIERYVTAHSGAKFTHGICPDCARKLFPEYLEGEKSD